MTPAARVQAAIELLDAIIVSSREAGAAADTLIARYFKTRRYAGSKDRRAVRDLVYRALRRAGERPASGRAAMLGLAQDDRALLDAFDGSAHGPVPLTPDEPVAAAGIAPSWLLDRLDPLIGGEEQQALLGRAPLDLRVNRLKGSREQALELLPDATPTPLSPLGLRLPEGFPVDSSEAWQGGLVEIQDEGSQLACLACKVAPGMTVIDLCAGGGGKTLALAAELAGEGRIVACDADRARLARQPQRLARAGVEGVELRLLDPGREAAALADLAGRADLVLVDAPCSGSGTWRRNPETRWRVDEKRLAVLVNLQAHLLDVAAPLVRPGGSLVYVVCSLLAEEGRLQADRFLTRSSMVPENLAMTAGREAGHGRLLSPGSDGTDGFFIARFRSP